MPPDTRGTDRREWHSTRCLLDCHALADVMGRFRLPRLVSASHCFGPTTRRGCSTCVAATHDRKNFLVEYFRLPRMTPPSAGRTGCSRDARLEKYLQAFTELGTADALKLRLVTEEFRVRPRSGDRPSHAEYATRFPALAGMSEGNPANGRSLAACQPRRLNRGLPDYVAFPSRDLRFRTMLMIPKTPPAIPSILSAPDTRTISRTRIPASANPAQ